MTFSHKLMDNNFNKQDVYAVFKLLRKKKLILTQSKNVSLLNFGISDEFVQHGNPDHQKVASGLGREEITDKINKRLTSL